MKSSLLFAIFEFSRAKVILLFEKWKKYRKFARK